MAWTEPKRCSVCDEPISLCQCQEERVAARATTHDLKVWPEFFDALERNEKQFEVRKNDRGYKVGDALLLREWSPVSETYSGREIRRNVYYVMHGGRFGVEPGFVVLSIS